MRQRILLPIVIRLALNAETSDAEFFWTASETPLHLAARKGHMAIVKLLLAPGAHPKIEGGPSIRNRNYFASDYAKSTGYKEIEKLLIEHHTPGAVSKVVNATWKTLSRFFGAPSP